MGPISFRWAILLAVLAALTLLFGAAPGLYFGDKALFLRGVEAGGKVLIVGGTIAFWMALTGCFDERGEGV